ncbi:MAG: hypothetical protein ACI4EN_08255 [Butyrivibrio sp.]
MLKYEIKKYICNKVVVFLILGFVILKIVVSFFSLNINVPFGINIYKEYLKRWDGELTEYKATEIEAEYERLSTISQMYEDKKTRFLNGEITFEEFDKFTEEYNLSDAQVKAFEPVYAKYYYFAESDEKVEFFYDLEIIELAELFKKDFVLVLLICFVIAAVYDMESRSDISIIIRSLPEGRQKFQKNKIVTAIVFAIITTVLFCGIDIAIYGYKYSFENWGRTVHSIQSLNGFPINTTIANAFLIIMAVKVIYGTMIAGISILISKTTKRMFLTVFIGVIIFALPMLIW